MYVEVNGFSFLLDTGMSDVALKNSHHFNIDLSAVDAIVLSHGHLDHTGGLQHILNYVQSKKQSQKVVAHSDVFQKKFSSRHFETEDISIPLSQREYEQLGAEFEFVNGVTEIGPGVFVSGEIAMKTDFEHIDGGLLVEQKTSLIKDALRDDLSVAIKTKRGLVILLGCAHRGPINIVQHFQKALQTTDVYAIVGGLHLRHAETSRISKTIRHFKEMGVKKIACSHCTGFDASVELKNEFGKHFILNTAGKRLILN